MLRRIIRLLLVHIGTVLFMAQPFLVRRSLVHPVRELLLMAELLDVMGRLDLLRLAVFMLWVLLGRPLVRIQLVRLLLRLALLAEPAKQAMPALTVVLAGPVCIGQARAKPVGVVLMVAELSLLVQRHLRCLTVSMIRIVVMHTRRAQLVPVLRLVAYMPLLRQVLRVLFGIRVFRLVRMDVRVLAA